jgi:hypothetical protein
MEIPDLSSQLGVLYMIYTVTVVISHMIKNLQLKTTII